MNAFNRLAMGGTAALNAYGAVLTLFAGGIVAFALALRLFRWDSQSRGRRGQMALALLAFVPYAVWLFIV